MANLYEILAEAQNGEAMAEIGRAYGLTQEQTDAAVAALLPAISMGLKRSTETPEGLGNLFALMAQRPYLYASYNDPRVGVFAQGSCSRERGTLPDVRLAGGKPRDCRSGAKSFGRDLGHPEEASAGHRRHDHFRPDAQRFGTGCAASAAAAPAPAPDQGGGLIDILRQIFQQGRTGGGRSAGSRLGVDSLGHPSHRRHSRRT